MRIMASDQNQDKDQCFRSGSGHLIRTLDEDQNPDQDQDLI